MRFPNITSRGSAGGPPPLLSAGLSKDRFGPSALGDGRDALEYLHEPVPRSRQASTMSAGWWDAIEVYLDVEISIAEFKRFVPWHDARACTSLRSDRQVGASMQLLELRPPEFGLAKPGVHVVDDDGAQVWAGPFDNDAAALAWIEQRQRRLSRDVPDQLGAF